MYIYSLLDILQIMNPVTLDKQYTVWEYCLGTVCPLLAKQCVFVKHESTEQQLGLKRLV